MTREEAKKRIEKLKNEINRYRYAYHVLNKSLISESALDSLKHELWQLERQFPELMASDSPTQRVAGRPLKEFLKIRHPEPMLSIEDVFSFEELKEWQDYMAPYLSKNAQFDYFCERKIDGIDIVLTYKKGVLAVAATRGDGIIGEDVTQNIKTIEAVPLKLERPIDVVVRGEIFMHKKDFENLNKEQKKRGLPLFANPRNITAGSVRQLDPQITASRNLDCFVFEIITDLGQKTHQEVHWTLSELGFKTDREARQTQNLEEVEKFHQHWYKRRADVSFEYDGVVVLVNNIKYQKQLGVVGKSPRWMRAYKFPGEEATTIVKDIIVQIGRTGTLTPVAIFKPTRLMGSTVSRATLHNEDEIKRLEVRIGDTVVIQKAGDIIPDVVKVLKKLRTGQEKKFIMPRKCPICGEKVERKAGEAAYYCLNKRCFASRWRSLLHFVSKKGFDIDGLGEKIIEQLMNDGLIKNPADIFTLTRGDLEPLERFAEKSAQNLVEAIEKSKKIELWRLIYALGIRHIGEENALILANKLADSLTLQPTIKNLIQRAKNWSLGDLQKIQDIGPIVSQSIYQWFQNRDNIELLKNLAKNGVQIKISAPRTKNQKLADKKFVLTGEMDSLTRDEAKIKIRELGGAVSESVSKKTDFVVAGREPGSKYRQAKKLGVKIIEEKEFRQMLGSD